MVLSVNSSSKVDLAYPVIAVLATVGLGTILFYHARDNGMAQTAPSLAQKDVSILRSIPVLGSALNYFCPIQAPTEPVLDNRAIGNLHNRLTSIEDLTWRLENEQQHHQNIGVLIIYGDNLEIIKDPGIIALNPMKLILVGANIVKSNEVNSLEQCMIKKGWCANAQGVTPLKVGSVKEAENHAAPINPTTQKPFRMVYSVQVPTEPVLPNRAIGNPNYRLASINDLTRRLGVEQQQHQSVGVLTIYGDNLEIVQDPGIIALNPMKLILVGANIVKSNEVNSLEQCMIKSGWSANTQEVTPLKVGSVKEAVDHAAPINPKTQKPFRMVYSVEV